jgi:quercetin dioxygenase-like cupin family protein
MLIDFANIQEDVIPNMLGGQGDFCHKKFQDDAMKVMQGRLAPGASLGLHTHETNCEVIYIISGSGRVLCDGVYEDLPSGSTHYCPQGHSHGLENNGSEELRFLAVIPQK